MIDPIMYSLESHQLVCLVPILRLVYIQGDAKLLLKSEHAD
jgi:hypothetical protein